MGPHLESDLFGKNLNLGGEQSTDTERMRRIENARLPIAEIGAKLLQRVGNILFQRGETGFGLFPILHDDGADEIGFTRKMMVDTRFADADHIGDIGITEAVVPAPDKKHAGATKNVFGGGGKIAHASMPTN